MTDSLLGWASQTELKLTQRLAENPYFPETGFNTDELERLDRLFGTFLSRQVSAGANLADLLEITPAMTVSTLVSRASRMLDRDGFFQEYLVGLGLDAKASWAEDVAVRVPELLTRAGLEVPGEADPVDLLAFHAGVTGSEVAGLLSLFDQLPAETTGETLVAMLADDSYRPLIADEELEDEDQLVLPVIAAVAMLAPTRLAGLLDGVQALRRFSTSHPSSWLDRDRSQLEPTPPKLIAEAIEAELRERPVGTLGRQYTVGVATRELRPRLILDIERRKVCLRLPEQKVSQDDEGDGGEVAWRVSLEGTTRIFRTGRPWGEPTYAEALDVAVEHQTREATVQDITNGISWVVPLVDNEDPVLIFAANGQNLSDKISLHHAELLVLTPADATLVDVVTGDEVPVLEIFEVQGWNSWICRRLDTSRVASLQVVRPGQSPSAMQQLRSIDPRQRVRFRHPAPALQDIRSTGGLEVFPESLMAEFPPTLSGSDEIWYLSISAYSGIGEAGEEVAEPEPLAVPAAGGVFHIFDPEAYEVPWVGEYLIRLRGPRNESFRHRYAIVEGMYTQTDVAGLCHSVRIPAQGGLSEAQLTVGRGEKTFEVTPRRISVAPDAAGADFSVTTEEGDQLPLRFTPPRLAFEVPLLSYPAMWRTTRLELAPRQFDPAGHLRIRGTGHMGNPRISIINHHGSPLRSIKLESHDGGITWTAPMAAIAASTSVMPSGRLQFEWTCLRSDKRVTVNIAAINSTPHASALSVSEGQLVFEDLVQERQLAAWIWPETAPWAFARTIAIDGAATPLPEALIDAGPLLVQLHTDDPFTNLRPPLQPGAGALRAEQPGHFAEQPAALQALSAFLSGETEEPPADPQVLPVLWDHIAAWTVADGGESLVNRSSIQAVLEAQPQAALAALSASLVPADKQPGRVIASGLVNISFGVAPEVTAEESSEELTAEDLAAAVVIGEEPEIVTAPAAPAAPAVPVIGDASADSHRAAWIGSLELLGQLPELFAALEAEAEATGNPREAKAVLRAHLATLEKIAGKTLINTLATGRDSTLDSACIDQSTVMIAQMEASQQETLLKMFFANADIVPGPIMADSPRLLAVFETFKKREQLIDLLTSEGLIKPAVSLLRALRSSNRGLYSSARIRFDKLDGVNTEDRANAWALAPVVSLVFALSARMHAHGLMGKSRTLDKAARGWAQLADLVPDLVTGDLISAEAMVLAAKYPGIIA
ncbi:hypothetical protein [Corynebacterium sp. A21]|uniref:hypothetical protein n=1 Tax=Corynebacterium sp. A21 TaxID=3457318 RepID=UPI003FD515C1